ncbi:FAD binding domain-containing protein [Roseicella frigidaeris]|uniref:Xanthine dehydrogenase family protein subunit M n=1 Tax=Roseicella frigidaeris TaxID=2230885 RepID=A0A327MD58_9PROT|nr:FAD binding domain-containing protein [Roseicella frigidaeris]RAI60346.1 xanthine dehydrogenase family protein subunit M [Roseicella frigidaeris]
MPAYHRPTCLREALDLLAAVPAMQPLAGGTDIYPARAAAEAWLQPRDRPLLDLSALPGMAGIAERPDHHRIGAGTRWATIRDAGLPPWFDGLRGAAAWIGGRQVQSRATLGGNLCNASPAADGAPPLLALGAELELACREGRRRLPLSSFLLGNRRTALAPGEIMTAVIVPKPGRGATARFDKLGSRAFLVISLVSVAVVIEAEAGRITRARIAIGACSAVPQRLPALEADLAGLPLGLAAAVPEPAHLAPLAPIDDVRASAAYRRHAALVLLRRALAPSLAGAAA